MIDFIRKNLFALLLVLVAVCGYAYLTRDTPAPTTNNNAGSFRNTRDTTTVTNPWVFTQDLTLQSQNLTGTATSSYFTAQGIEYAYVQVSMVATSSVICTIPPPFGAATSTPVGPMIINITANGIAQNQNLFIATSSSASATTTSNAWSGSLPVTGSKFGTFFFTGNMATTSLTASPAGTNDANVLPGLTTGGATNRFLAPTDNLLVAIGTSTAGTFTSYYTGTCSQVFAKY